MSAFARAAVLGMVTVTVSVNRSHSFNVRSFLGGSIFTLTGSRTSEGTSETTGLKKGRTSEALSLAKSTAAPDSSRTTLVAGELALSLSVAENRKILFPLDGI